jgi:hypothetical protein
MIIASSKARGLALLVVTFVAGGVGGVGLDRAWFRQQPPALAAAGTAPQGASRGQRRPGGETVESDRIPFPLEQLQLTDAETVKLHEIARRWRPQAAQSMEQIRASISELENNMFAEMLCAISKEKQERYLAQLEENGADHAMIDKRFALVRSNRCESVKRGDERR